MLPNWIKILSVCTFFVQTIFLYPAFGKLQNPEDRERALKELEGIEIPLPVNCDAFGVGEFLDFGIYVALPGVGKLPIIGGHGILEVPNIVLRNKRMCYWLRARAYSSGIVGQVYPVEDIIESFMDVDSFYPLQFRKDVSEGKYSDKYTIEFDPKKNRAIRFNESGGHVFDVQTYAKVQDIISGFYYVRTLEFEPGDSIPLPYHDNGGNYPIWIFVHRREKVEVPAGKFDCIVIEPIIKAEGLFKKKGRMWIWLTDDDRKMPVKMESKIPVGSVRAILLEFRRGEANWR